MLQLTTKIIHPSLYLSFALYNKSVVTCHKIHHSHHNYHSRGCVSRGRCKERCRDGCMIFVVSWSIFLLASFFIIYTIPTSPFILKKWFFHLFHSFLVHAQPHPFLAAEWVGGAAARYNYVRIDAHARATALVSVWNTVRCALALQGHRIHLGICISR